MTCNMIVGVDPSFRGTGIVVWNEKSSTLLFHTKFKTDEPVYSKITDVHHAAEEVVSLLRDVQSQFPYADWIVEYPALATRSGAYLAILHGYIAQFLNSRAEINSVTYVPPTACNSFSHNVSKTKSYLVQFVKDNYGIKGRFSNDEATALILANLLVAIRNKEYKNSYFKYNKR